jgi:hypothetical protein
VLVLVLVLVIVLEDGASSERILSGVGGGLDSGPPRMQGCKREHRWRF